MIVLCVANNKGGVGKTTTVVNLAAAIGKSGRKTLVIDADGQGNATYSLTGLVHPTPSLYDVLMEKIPLEKIILPSNEDFVSVVPGDPRLQNIDIELAAKPAREWKLSRAMRQVDFEYVIIDTPPSLGLLTQNALAAAQHVIIPVSLSEFSLIGMDKLLATIDEIGDELNIEDLDLLGVLVTFYDETRLSRETYGILEKKFEEHLLTTRIPKSIKLEESHRRNESIVSFLPNSPAGQAYTELAQEVIKKSKAAQTPYSRKQQRRS